MAKDNQNLESLFKKELDFATQEETKLSAQITELENRKHNVSQSAKKRVLRRDKEKTKERVYELVTVCPIDLKACSFTDCAKKASIACPVCSQILYCTKKHLKQNTQAHADACLKFKASYSWKLGRHMIATQDLNPSDAAVSINSERPKIFVPFPFDPIRKNQYVCSVCCIHWPTKKSDYGTAAEVLKFCDKCKWPVCISNCKFINPAEAELLHCNNECSYLQTMSLDADTATRLNAYDCLLLNRVLSLKESIHGEAAKMYTNILENFGSTETVTDSMKIEWKFVIDIVRNQFNENYVSDDEIIRWMYIIPRRFLDTFRADDSLTPEKGVRYGRGLYDFGSSVIHSCVPNCYFHFDGGNLTTFLSSPIKKGEILTASYDLKIILEPTGLRKAALKERYLIDCSCPRCIDPTEFGTYYNGIPCNQTESCKEGKNGFILPKDISNQQLLWECNVCHYEFEGRVVEYWLKKMEHQILTQGSYYCQNAFIKEEIQLWNSLHWNHYLVFKASLRIMLGLYFSLRTIRLDVVGEKEKFAKELKNYREVAGCVNNIVSTFYSEFNNEATIAQCRLAALIQLEEFAEQYATGKMNLEQLEEQIRRIYFRDLESRYCLLEFNVQKGVLTMDGLLGLEWFEERALQILYDAICPSGYNFDEILKESAYLFTLLQEFPEYRRKRSDSTISDIK